MAVDPSSFRDALGRFLSGVTVVLTEDEAGVHGMTASAFTSVSLDPPLVAVCVAHKAHMHGRLRAAGWCTVSVLGAEQESESNHFAARTAMAAEGAIARALDGRPVIAGAIATLACTVEQEVTAGDHAIFVLRVDAAESAEGAPLGYWRGGYRRIA
jgi:flavin reductase (DIM6/NTAB) family NADH-FMN oxidoreductase RutF